MEIHLGDASLHYRCEGGTERSSSSCAGARAGAVLGSATQIPRSIPTEGPDPSLSRDGCPRTVRIRHSSETGITGRCGT